MKLFYTILLSFFFIAPKIVLAQNGTVKSDFISTQSYLSPNSLKPYSNYYGDSLKGFDEAFYKAEYLNRGLFGQEFITAINSQKRYFINTKYQLGFTSSINTPQNQSSAKLSGSANFINVFPCVNEDFEASLPGQYSFSNAVAGWTVESGLNTSTIYPPNLVYGAACLASPIPNWTGGSPEFSIVATPMLSVPFIGILPHSPFGGTKVARLQNTGVGNALMTRISTMFPVTATNNLFQLAYAGSWDGVHECCGSPSFRINIYSCNNGIFTPIPCGDLNLSPGCPNVAPGYTLTNNIYWTNWTIKNIDLSAYLGQCIKISILCSDCAYAGHHGSAFIDARCGSLPLLGGVVSQVPNTVNFCAGANQAVITAPSGFSGYQWIAPGGLPIAAPIGTAPSLTISPPISNSVYTVQVTGPSCSTNFIYTLNPTPISIAAVISGSTCLNGSGGSATVMASGSGNGYNYTWLNSANLTVGTSSIVTNLPIGVYSVAVSAIGAAGCGTAMATASINLQPLYTEVNKLYCNVNPTICPGPGSNFQWYNNSSPIAAPSGTASCLSIANPSNGAIYMVRYLNAGGCLDSIKYTLSQISPGNISTVNSPASCLGASNATAVISMTSALGAPFGANSFSVFSTGSLTPAYNATLNPTALYNYSLSGLSIGSYSIIAFDGICSYTGGISIPQYAKDFVVSPSSATLCSGNSFITQIYFTSLPLPNQYTYSWSPAMFLSGTNSQQVLLTPTVSPGLVNTIIYTVAVTPSVVNCAITDTISITVANPLTPTISTIPVLCNYSPAYTINVNPSGGVFSSPLIGGNFPIGNFNGIITPSLANNGLNTFTYTSGTGTCVLSSSASYTIGGPTLTVSGNATICPGTLLTLQAGGANTYTWSNGANGSSIQVSPVQSSIYTVTASQPGDPCTSSKSISITVEPAPLIQIIGSYSICLKDTVTLSAGGANTYTWNTGSNTAQIQVSPLVTTIFTVSGTGTLNACITSNTHTLLVMPKPNLFITGNGAMCIGDNNILTASGAHTYTWNTGSNNAALNISPLINTAYSVSGTYTNSGCASTYTCFITVTECVGLSENEKNNSKLKVYPNPSNGVITIENKQEVEITIFNELGQLILKQNLTAGIHSIDLSVYASGIYFIKTNTNKKAEVFRLIKEN